MKYSNLHQGVPLEELQFALDYVKLLRESRPNLIIAIHIALIMKTKAINTVLRSQSGGQCFTQ